MQNEREITESEGPYWDEQQERRQFATSLDRWLKAGMDLAEAWDGDAFHAEDAAPLPDALRPPMSLDEWMMELRAHFETAELLPVR